MKYIRARTQDSLKVAFGLKGASIAVVALLLAGCNLFQANENVGDAGLDADNTVTDVNMPVDAAVDTGGRLDMRPETDLGRPDLGSDAGSDMDECVAETDEAFCTRQGKNCGTLSGIDDCGRDREAMCGDCPDGDCGDVEANVCGCPCDIDGECRIAGERDPDSECMVCDPDVDAMGWTVDEGAQCDDENACSEESTCDAAGLCVAVDAEGCEALANECQVGSCDAASMSCTFDPIPDDTACSDDGLDCTTDQCAAGMCAHPIDAGFCVIDAACFANGAHNPANPCEVCDAAASPTAWTIEDGASCDDGDGLACTSGTCDAAGVCQSTLAAGQCVINNVCRADGFVRGTNACQYCDPAQSTSDWSGFPANTPCDDGDGLSCTAGICNSAATCVPDIDAASCVISNACVAAGTTAPGNECKSCDPPESQNGYSDVTDGTTCGTPLSCQAASCDGGVCKTTTDPGFCVIAGACVADGMVNPNDPCQACQAAVDDADWSGLVQGTVCSIAPACECASDGECLRSNGNPC